MAEGSPAFRRFAADGALVLGGGAAILLQLGDPVVARGVAEHSAFARDPLRRLHATLGYVYAVSLGAEELRALAARSVDAAHAGVPGARDPEHQLWVAATLYWTAIRVRRLLGGPLPAPLAAEALARFGELGAALQLPPGDWPADADAFAALWSRSVRALEVGEDARAVCRQLLHPVAGPWWLRAAMPLGRLVTAGLLPAAVREAYGLPWSAARRVRFLAALTGIRVVLAVLPCAVREFPSRRLLAGLAARAGRRGAAASGPRPQARTATES